MTNKERNWLIYANMKQKHVLHLNILLSRYEKYCNNISSSLLYHAKADCPLFRIYMYMFVFIYLRQYHMHVRLSNTMC